MYRHIYVPVDNSEFSNRAIQLSVELSATLGAKLTGSHVYAAKMHDYRFKQMEFTLPEEYLQERELERQRKIHDSLITMGLELISDSYLDYMETKCQELDLPFERKMMDGKHFVEIIKDIEESDYDLTIMGAHGIGKVRDSDLGSVTTQVTRHANTSIWVVKEYNQKKNAERDTILVAVDGSPRSFGGLRTAFRLAKIFGKKIELISVYDPYLHYSVFSGIVNVLSEKAKKVFRFEEQNQLHEEIIDTGLAAIYQSHLNVAQSLAEEEGVEVTKTLLDGKAFQKILDHARKTEPWLLMIGRTGVHGEDGESGLGNTTENLLRLAPCDVYLNAFAEIPKIDLKAEEAIRWTDEAKDRMTRVPSLVRGIARTGILRLALEQGHSVITDSLITEAMERFMPKYGNDQTARKVAEAIAFEKALKQDVSMCNHCGVTAKEAQPVRCGVCGKSDFQIISQETIRQIAGEEGGLEEETAFDGRKLKWSREARLELKGLKDAYQRRRAKARIEKTARIKRIETITRDHVLTIIEEELGSLPIDIQKEKAFLDGGAEAETQPRKPVAATDADGNELLSDLDWDADAAERILNIPAGFMRDRTRDRVEKIASEQGGRVTLDMVMQGLEIGRQMMEEMLAQAGGAERVLDSIEERTPVKGDTGKCPFHAALSEKKPETKSVLNEVTALRVPSEG